MGKGEIIGLPLQASPMRRSLQNVLLDPGLGALVFDLLAVWPLSRLFVRVGLAPGWALLVFVPMVGMLLVIAVLGLKRWPLLPRVPKPPRKARRMVP